MINDMLVKLLNLPDYAGEENVQKYGVQIKRALAPDRVAIVNFVLNHFGENWAGECETSLSMSPSSCFIAVKEKKVVGFACFDVTALDYFGPIGIAEECRNMGIGTALLFHCLYSMKEKGYAYAIIGGVGDAAAFYKKTVNAIPIKDSYPGIYKGLITL